MRVLCALVLCPFLIDAHQSFVRRVPWVPANWPAIGHPHPNDGHGLNQLGIDFANVGNTWTRAFCLLDSDGDGRTNGEESGDFNCVWIQGQPAPVVQYMLTNPGVADVFTADDELTFQNRYNHTLQTTSPTTSTTSRAPTVSPNSTNEGTLTIEPWLIAHTVLGAFSLGLLFPIATGMTTLCRRRMGGSWKEAHVWTSLVASVLFFTAFVLPISIVDSDDIEGVITSSHGISAILLFLCMIGQILSGVLLRWWRKRGSNWLAHSIVANTLVSLLGLVVLLTGYDLLQDQVQDLGIDSSVLTVQVLGTLHVIGYITFWILHLVFTVRKRFKSFVRLAETHTPLYRFSSSKVESNNTEKPGVDSATPEEASLVDNPSDALGEDSEEGQRYTVVNAEFEEPRSVRPGLIVKPAQQALTEI